MLLASLLLLAAGNVPPFAQAQSARPAPPITWQTPDTPPQDDIVVTGQKPRTDEIWHQARAITPEANIRTEPMARFDDAVCPGVIGLPPELASLVIDRIRYNAERIGIEVAKREPCVPNIFFAVVRDGKSDLLALKRKNSPLIAGIDYSELNALIAAPGPVRAWSNTAMRGRHGEVPSIRPDGVQVISMPSAHSRIYLPTRRDITSSIVEIDMAAINGLSVNQIADYVSMRAFARTRPPTGDPAAYTILSLFEPAGTRPAEMTPFDLAYLKSLYRDIPNLPGSAKVGAVPRMMRKEQAGAVPARTEKD